MALCDGSTCQGRKPAPQVRNQPRNTVDASISDKGSLYPQHGLILEGLVA